MKATYKIHRFDVVIRTYQARFEQFLNSLEEEVVSVIPKCFSNLDFWKNMV